MSMVCPPPVSGTKSSRDRFRTLPWPVEHPDRLALDRRLPRDHLARVIDYAVDQLDLTQLRDSYRGRGSLPYPPEPLLKAVLYQVQRQRQRPAQWHTDATESEPVRWLLCGLVPSRACWYQFRDRLGPTLLAWTQQVVQRAVAEGFSPAQRGALDGTTVAAHASRRQLLNEAALDKRCQQLQAVPAAEASAAAPPEPAAAAAAAPPEPAAAAAAPSEPPRWLAPTAAGRRRQARRYARAHAAMARRQQRNRCKRAGQRTAPERLLISPGDPEAAVGRDKDKLVRALYNVQVLDDLDSPLVLGWSVVAQPNDAGLLGGLLRQARDGLGRALEVVLCDAAYAGGADLADAAALGATVYSPWQAHDFSAPKQPRYYPKDKFVWLPQERAYLCPQGQRLPHRSSAQQRRSGTERIELQVYRADAAVCVACPARQQCTPGRGPRTISRSEHEELIEALRQRMQTTVAKQLYRQRKQTVELAHADLKEHRGLRRLSGHGLRRAQAQVGLVMLAHNLVALDGLRRRRRTADPAAAKPDLSAP